MSSRTIPCRTKWVAVSLATMCVFAVGPGVADAQTGSIAGRVMDTQSAAVAGAGVSLTSVAGRRIETRSGSDGAFSFAQLSSGTSTLRVEAPGFAPWSQNVTVGSAAVEPLAITLTSPG